MKRLIFAVFLFLSALPCFAQQVCTRSLSGVNYVTSSTYLFVSLDTVRLTNFSNTTGIAATLASGITNPEFGSCAEIAVWNAGLGEVVIACAGCTINGSPTLKLESLQSADLYGDGQNYVALMGGTIDSQLSYPNSSGGTTCNGFAKVDQTLGSSTFGKAVNTAIGDSLPILGVVRSGCGASGNATVLTTGPIQVLFDSASITVGDAVGISATTAAAAFDLGSPFPTSSAVIVGTIILSPFSGALPSGCTVAPGCWILLKPAGAGGGGGGGGSPNAVVTNPATNATNSIQPTVSTVQGLTVKGPASAGSSLPVLQANDNSSNQLFGVLENGSVVLGKSGAPPSVGSNTAANTDLDGELTMSSNTATYAFSGTYSSHPTCIASNETATAANSGIKVTYTGVVSVTFTTTGASDVISYHCLFRN